MKKRIIITAIVLITLLSSLTYSVPIANDTDLNRAIDAAELFLRQCTDNMYLYHDNDISEMTTASFNTSKLSKVSAEAKKTISTYKNNSDNSFITIEEFPYFIEEKVNYFKTFRSERNIEREDFNVDYYVKNSSINGNFAIIEIIEDISFFYVGKNARSSIQTDYNILLYKEDKTWSVCNVISDDDFDRYYKTEDLSFEKLNSEAQKETLRLKSDENKIINSEEAPKGLAEVFKERINNKKNSAPEKAIILNPTGIDYDGYNAACYALTYSRTGHGENVSNGYYNSNFYNFNSVGGDCQNFASQCIWAGFNGNNDPDAINKLLRPMDGDNPQWYCDGKGNKSSSWATPSFFDEYTNDTGNGVRIDATKSKDNADLYTSSLQLGDEVIVNNGGHAIIIVDFDKTDAYFSAHSGNVRRGRLKDYNFNKGKIIRPTKYVYSKRYSDGGNHIFSQNIPAAYGVDASCNNTGCTHNRMQVSGMYQEPMPEKLSISMPIQLNCSLIPYRIAIGITDPNGKATWYEELNVASKTVYYQFKEKGLYTITLSARDKNPDKYSDSISTTVKYTIRVISDDEYRNEYYYDYFN